MKQLRHDEDDDTDDIDDDTQYHDRGKLFSVGFVSRSPSRFYLKSIVWCFQITIMIQIQQEVLSRSQTHLK